MPRSLRNRRGVAQRAVLHGAQRDGRLGVFSGARAARSRNIALAAALLAPCTSAAGACFVPAGGAPVSCRTNGGRAAGRGHPARRAHAAGRNGRAVCAVRTGLRRAAPPGKGKRLTGGPARRSSPGLYAAGKKRYTEEKRSAGLPEIPIFNFKKKCRSSGSTDL